MRLAQLLVIGFTAWPRHSLQVQLGSAFNQEPSCPAPSWLPMQAAFALLAQFPRASLESRLSLADWQTLLDVGLAGLPPSGPATAGPAGGSGTVGGGAAAKHAASIQEAAQQLLLRFLGLEDAGEEGEQQQRQREGEAGQDFVPASDEEEEEEEAEGEGGSSHRLADADMEDAAGSPAGSEGASGSEHSPSPAWLARLEALRTLPPHADGCPLAAHLAAAWHAALVAALSSEQQAAAGIASGEGEAAAEGELGEDDDDDMWLQ